MSCESSAAAPLGAGVLGAAGALGGAFASGVLLEGSGEGGWLIDRTTSSRVIAADDAALAHEPSGDGPLRDTLAELRHEDIDHRCLLLAARLYAVLSARATGAVFRRVWRSKPWHRDRQGAVCEAMATYTAS